MRNEGTFNEPLLVVDSSSDFKDWDVVGVRRYKPGWCEVHMVSDNVVGPKVFSKCHCPDDLLPECEAASLLLESETRRIAALVKNPIHFIDCSAVEPDRVRDLVPAHAVVVIGTRDDLYLWKKGIDLELWKQECRRLHGLNCHARVKQPGWGKRVVTDFELLNTENEGAEFSPCRRYRYSLWRVWDTKRPRVVFIGLNPSTADERTNDPTIRRCIGFAKGWGYGGIWMLNIFAFRATDPKEMKREKDPVGTDNNGYLIDVCTSAELVILAWGSHGNHRGRAAEVIDLLTYAKVDFKVLGVTKHGQPKHPLYLRKDLVPVIGENIC